MAGGIVCAIKSPAALSTSYRAAIRTVIDDGAIVDVGDSRSTASGRRTLEVMNYDFVLADCRDRIAVSQVRPFNLFAAVGRWVWLISGSSLLREIEFYDRHARRFSDDGIVVPGSSDGARLIAPRPGLNQLQSVIDLLRRETNTRRAAVTIYAADDVGRDSVDVPCTMGLIFNLRDDVLHTSVLMRANNALTVVPYDVFQFSMLAELIAAELGVAAGPYYHYAASMHIYADDLDQARAVCEEQANRELAMPMIPRGAALAGARRLVAFEAKLRAVAEHAEPSLLTTLGESIDSEVGEYWADLGRVLLVGAIRRADLPDETRDAAVGSVLANMDASLEAIVEACVVS